MLGIAIFTIVVSKRIMKKPRQSVINASQGLCRSVTFDGPPGVAVADAVTSLPLLSRLLAHAIGPRRQSRPPHPRSGSVARTRRCTAGMIPLDWRPLMLVPTGSHPAPRGPWWGAAARHRHRPYGK